MRGEAYGERYGKFRWILMHLTKVLGSLTLFLSSGLRSPPCWRVLPYRDRKMSTGMRSTSIMNLRTKGYLRTLIHSHSVISNSQRDMMIDERCLSNAMSSLGQTRGAIWSRPQETRDISSNEHNWSWRVTNVLRLNFLQDKSITQRREPHTGRK